MEDTHTTLTQIDRSNGGLSIVLIIIIFDTAFRGSIIRLIVCYFRCCTAFSQKTDYQCSHPNQLRSNGRVYEAGTERSSDGINQGPSINAN